MIYRTFQQSDTEDVVSLWLECGLVRPWNDPYKDIERKLSEQPELFLVVEADGVVIATAMGGNDGHRGWVYYLAVSKRFRGQGIARRLMGDLEEKLIAVGCPKIQLMVRKDNSDVLHFYRQLGYEDASVVTLGKRLIPDD